MKKIHKIVLVEIVEDEEPVLNVLSSRFEKEGFEVIRASDGEEGLKAALEHQPDLILLDLLMPRMDGISMLKKLREDDWGKNVPVIVLTNLNDADKVASATEGGAFDFLVKADWKLEDLVKKVRQKLNIK